MQPSEELYKDPLSVYQPSRVSLRLQIAWAWKMEGIELIAYRGGNPNDVLLVVIDYLLLSGSKLKVLSTLSINLKPTWS